MRRRRDLRHTLPITDFRVSVSSLQDTSFKSHLQLLKIFIVGRSSRIEERDVEEEGKVRRLQKGESGGDSGSERGKAKER